MSVDGKNLCNKTAVFPDTLKESVTFFIHAFCIHTFYTFFIQCEVDKDFIYIIHIFHISNMKENFLCIIPIFLKLVQVRPSWPGGNPGFYVNFCFT